MSEELSSRPLTSGESGPPQNISTPAPIRPAPGTAVGSLPPVGALGADNDNEGTLFVTAVGVRQPLSQAQVTSQVAQATPMTTPESPDVIEPIRPVANPSQLPTDRPQTVAESYQSLPEPPQVPAGDGLTDRRPDSPAPIPFQLPKEVVDIASNTPTPKVPYRVRNPSAGSSGNPPRRSSINGAPEVVVDAIDDEEEITVDLRDYVNMESDNETHVSSSQKSADEPRELSPPLPDSQRRHGIKRTEGSVTQSKFPSTRTLPQLNVDEGDLPVWMMKKGQWRYVSSTAGGIAWENLLKLYMNQERRLEFSETVSNLTRIPLLLVLSKLKGVSLTNEDRPSRIKEYFQYAHQPSRGDTLTSPGFGAEVAKWWERIQPEWRRSEQDLPESPSQWSYILSGGSKGAFLVILCLAWWDRAYERSLKKQKEERRIEAEASGVAPNFNDLPDHDAEWLNTVNDVAFVMRGALKCDVPTRGVSSPSHRVKRKREAEPTTPRKKSAAGLSRTRSKA